jgi:16S rRNA G966 N2-methylase RsmD
MLSVSVATMLRMLHNSNSLEIIKPSLCVVFNSDERWSEQAKCIAQELRIPHYSINDEIRNEDILCSHILDVVSYGDTYALGIRQIFIENPSGRSRGHGLLRSSSRIPLPYIVDFCPSPKSRVAQRSQSGSDLLLKAVAPKKIPGGADVLDLTAGFGQDSWLISENGASSVHMVERHPIVAALLKDALRRREEVSKQSNLYPPKLLLTNDNGIDFMATKSITDPVDVCYLDPMFPPRTKSSAVKKNMQILHSLLDSQECHNVEESCCSQTTHTCTDLRRKFISPSIL